MNPYEDDYPDTPPKCDLCNEYDTGDNYKYCVNHESHHCEGCWDSEECAVEE